MTLVAEVAANLQKFAARWAQSASTNYDVLVATMLSSDWITEHELVISTQGSGHMIYTEYSHSFPGGRFVACLNGCQGVLRYKPVKTKIRYTCRNCTAVGWVKRVPKGDDHFLNTYNMAKAKYPQSRARVLWTKQGEEDVNVDDYELPDCSAPEDEG